MFDSLRLLQLIKSASCIYLTSHVDSDSDSIGSILAIYNVIKQKYPTKDIIMNIEAYSDGIYSFLKSSAMIKDETMLAAFKKYNPDLVIMLDGNNYGRFTKGDVQSVEQYIKKNNVKTIIIDHHPKVEHSTADLYIQKNLQSTCDIVYDIFARDLKYKIDKEIAYCIMMGILGDTCRFYFSNQNPKHSMRVGLKLMDLDKDIIGYIERRLGGINKEKLEMLSDFISNTTIKNGYAFSYISDEKFKALKDGNMNISQYLITCAKYNFEYLINIEDTDWGFTVYHDFNDSDYYQISFRSTGKKDVSLLAKELGGGGHKPAAGARVKANNVNEAITIIQSAVRKLGY